MTATKRTLKDNAREYTDRELSMLEASYARKTKQFGKADRVDAQEKLDMVHAEQTRRERAAGDADERFRLAVEADAQREWEGYGYGRD